MKKLYRYIKFRLKVTCKDIVQHFGLTFSASIAVSVTLILISVFVLLTNNFNNFTKHIEQQIIIHASIDTIVKDKQKQQLLHAIEQLNTMRHVTLSTGEEELEDYKAEFQDDSAMFDMCGGKANLIRDTFLTEVKNGKDIQKTADKIENMKGIVSAEYGGDSTSGMISTFKKIREGSMISIIFLIVVAVFLISNKIKVSTYTQKREITVMHFIGTSDWAIKFPIMLEGVFTGVLGNLVPVLLTIFGYQYVYIILGGIFMSDIFVLQTVFLITLEMSGILILIGVLVGLVGSFFSTTRYLHWKR